MRSVSLYNITEDFRNSTHFLNCRISKRSKGWTVHISGEFMIDRKHISFKNIVKVIFCIIWDL